MNCTLLKLMIAMGLSHAVFPANVLAQDRVQTPREFCLATGGSINEAGDAHIFICCYESRQKCVLNDEQRRYSRRISIAPEDQRLQMSRENRGGAGVD